MRYVLLLVALPLTASVVLLAAAKQTRDRHGRCNWCHSLLKAIGIIISSLALFLNADTASDVQAD